MRVLLDTHIWLWRLLEPERLPARLEAVIADRGTEVHLSPISVWETLVLARKGRLALEPGPVDWVRAALRQSQPTMVPLNYEIAIRAETLDGFESRDPVDRLLVGTALVEDLAILTSDRAMISFAELQTP